MTGKTKTNIRVATEIRLIGDSFIFLMSNFSSKLIMIVTIRKFATKVNVEVLRMKSFICLISVFWRTVTGAFRGAISWFLTDPFITWRSDAFRVFLRFILTWATSTFRSPVEHDLFRLWDGFMSFLPWVFNGGRWFAALADRGAVFFIFFINLFRKIPSLAISNKQDSDRKTTG